MSDEPWQGSYLPMDCPNCGRARLYVWLEQGALRMKCDKCGVTGFDCDDAEHERGGKHEQRPTFDD